MVAYRFPSTNSSCRTVYELPLILRSTLTGTFAALMFESKSCSMFGV